MHTTHRTKADERLINMLHMLLLLLLFYCIWITITVHMDLVTLTNIYIYSLFFLSFYFPSFWSLYRQKSSFQWYCPVLCCVSLPHIEIVPRCDIRHRTLTHKYTHTITHLNAYGQKRQSLMFKLRCHMINFMLLSFCILVFRSKPSENSQR